MEDNKNASKCIKIGVVGDSTVGKTAICNSLMGLEFSPDMLGTIGVDKSDKLVKVKNNEKIKVVLWDTAGVESFRSVVFWHIKNADGVILVFDFCLRESFINLDRWLNEIKENLKVSSIILFGNKADLNETSWVMTSEEVNKYVKKKRIPFFKVSAKTGKGLNEGLSYIVNEIYDKKSEETKNNKVIIIDENDIEKKKKKSDCVRNKKNKK